MTRRFSILKLQHTQILILILSKFIKKTTFGYIFVQEKYIILYSSDSYYFTLLYKVQSFMIDQVLYIRLSIFVILKNFYIRLGELFIRKLSSKLQYQFYRLLCSSPSFKIQSIRLNQTIRTTFYLSRYDSFFSDISISYLIHIKYSY